MEQPNIKDLVKGKSSTFMHYKKGALWYKTEDDFEFPVPVSDIGDGIFNHTEKAMTLMRYIRIHLKNMADGKAEND